MVLLFNEEDNDDSELQSNRGPLISQFVSSLVHTGSMSDDNDQSGASPLPTQPVRSNQQNKSEIDGGQQNAPQEMNNDDNANNNGRKRRNDKEEMDADDDTDENDDPSSQKAC